jgi:hypothetical protein
MVQALSHRSKVAIQSRYRWGRVFSWSRRPKSSGKQVSFAQANDGLGPVALGTTSGPTGRVGYAGCGLSMVTMVTCGSPMRANLWRDWGAEATMVFGGDPVPLIEEATRLEFPGGVSAKLGGGVGLYTQAGYQFCLDGPFLRDAIQGDIGLRYAW